MTRNCAKHTSSGESITLIAMAKLRNAITILDIIEYKRLDLTLLSISIPIGNLASIPKAMNDL